MKRPPFLSDPSKGVVMVVILLALSSCSHKFEGDSLDLGMYQWNLWSDTDAAWTTVSDTAFAGSIQEVPGHGPSCGWEAFHRGKGKLVRIPTRIDAHLKTGRNDNGADIFRGVAWYHCRFTLPEQWEGRKITLEFEEAGPVVEVYLNEKFVGGYQGMNAAISMDVTGTIFYTRDNHLSIRVTDPNGEGGGITGSLHVKPGDTMQGGDIH